MHPKHPHDATHRHETAPALTARGLLAQVALVAAVPLALVALAYPAATTLALAVLAVLVWHRRVGRARPRPRPTQPPD